jgi:hypothetical protein
MGKNTHIHRVPQNNHVDDESQRAQLVFLAFAIALTQLAAPPVEDHTRDTEVGCKS